MTLGNMRQFDMTRLSVEQRCGASGSGMASQDRGG